MNKKEFAKKNILGLGLCFVMFVCLSFFAVNLKDIQSVYAYTTQTYTITEIATAIENGGNQNDFSADNWITINNADELVGFSSLINTAKLSGARKYKLTADIELNENSSNYADWGYSPPANEWATIGSYYQFTGRFDGQGHTISGVYIDDSGIRGLFGYVSSACKIFNVNMTNYFIKGGEQTGGLVGINDGIVSNCRLANGLVCSGSNFEGDSLGGIVGKNSSYASILNCCNLSVVRGSGVTGDYFIGGIAGENNGIVMNCYNAGTIVGGANYKGSIGYFGGGDATNNYWVIGSCGINGGNCEQGKTDSFDENGVMTSNNNNTITEYPWRETNITINETRLVDVLNGYVSDFNLLNASNISTGVLIELKNWVSSPLPTFAGVRTIVFNNNDGTFADGYSKPETYLEGTTVTLPTADNISKVGYTFNGWTEFDTEWNETTNPYITSISAIDLDDKTYFANWSINTYTITWKNGETTLETDTNVEHGTMPTYNGTTPTKASDDEYSYEFNGWSPAIETASANATYIAEFSATSIETQNNLLWLWILLGIFGVGLVALALLWILFYKRKITFVLNGKEVGTAKFKYGEELNFPLNLARYKWFVDKEQTTFLTKQKMGWFGFTIYRNSESASSAEKKKNPQK